MARRHEHGFRDRATAAALANGAAPLFRPFLILLALIFLFEAWLWSHLAPIVAWIVDAHSAARHQGMGRRGDRAPAALRHAGRVHRAGHPAAAAEVPRAVDAGARAWLGALAVLAPRQGGQSRRDRLHLRSDARRSCCSLPGSATLYDWVLWLLAEAHALVDPIKRRVKLWLHIFSPKRASRTLRLLRRMRRTMHAARAQA